MDEGVDDVGTLCVVPKFAIMVEEGFGKSREWLNWKASEQQIREASSKCATKKVGYKGRKMGNCIYFLCEYNMDQVDI